MGESRAKIIALAGKGGVGKTSLAASIVRVLTEDRPGAKILAIDADPAVGLSTALGIKVTSSLDDIRRAVTEVLDAGWRTGDIKDAETPVDKVVGTAKMGDLVVEHL